MKHYLFFVATVLCTACTTPKVVEQHHHHYYEADTLSIQAQIDRSLNVWHVQMDSSWTQKWQEYATSMTSNEDQKEHITETITTWTDSLGREMRQEQRTTERSLSKMQQLSEERITHEYEIRLSAVIDSMNDVWQERFNAIQNHIEKSDSTSVQKKPAENTGTRWYQRWWQTLKDNLLKIIFAFALFYTMQWWMPWLVKLIRKLFPKQ